VYFLANLSLENGNDLGGFLLDVVLKLIGD